MHKRDYELIAAAIRESGNASNYKYVSDYGRGYEDARNQIINDISIILGIENTRFDVNKFKSACNR